MAYSQAKSKSSGDRASPCSRPFWIGKLSDRCLHIGTLLYVSFKHILIIFTYYEERIVVLIHILISLTEREPSSSI
jgi:hypothetical protein